MPNLQPGDFVVLMSVPPALIADLPEEDQVAIRDVVGKAVKFAGISYGQAELEFRDNQGGEHTIWVDPDRIRPAWRGTREDDIIIIHPLVGAHRGPRKVGADTSSAADRLKRPYS